MKKMIIHENQKGFLFKNGRYIRLVGAGKYRLFGGREIEISEQNHPIACGRCALATLLADRNVADRVAVVEVGDEQLALHYVNGRFSSVLRQGQYAFWSDTDRHEFKLVDISGPIVDESVPPYVFSKIPQMYYTKIEVAEHQRARLRFNQKPERVLDAGTYYFWKTSVKVDADYVDTRLTQMEIKGEELLTADQVSLRVGFVCNYRVTDCVRVLTEIDDFAGQLRMTVRLALSEYVGRHRLDEILENKAGLSEFVSQKLKAREQELFVEISDAGVTDVVLPEDIREIMNTVLVAEKQAQVDGIARREADASTRSLLRTAEMMDENQTLRKLKDMECVERICESVGNISLNDKGNVLTQILAILSGNKD